MTMNVEKTVLVLKFTGVRNNYANMLLESVSVSLDKRVSQASIEYCITFLLHMLVANVLKISELYVWYLVYLARNL